MLRFSKKIAHADPNIRSVALGDALLAVANAAYELDVTRDKLRAAIVAAALEAKPTPEKPWPTAWGVAADVEGWGIFNQGEDGIGEIQRDDEMDIFASDDDARAFVRKQAKHGSAMHATALKLHKPRRRWNGMRAANNYDSLSETKRHAFKFAG